MGYFSRKAAAVRERAENLPDRSCPSREMSLQFLLDHLIGKLEALNETRPRNALHPLYDGYFFESAPVCAYDESDTVQGLRRAIEITRDMIRQEENKHRGCLTCFPQPEEKKLYDMPKINTA